MTWAIVNKGYSQRRACGLVGMEPRVIVIVLAGRMTSTCARG